MTHGTTTSLRTCRCRARRAGSPRLVGALVAALVAVTLAGGAAAAPGLGSPLTADLATAAERSLAGGSCVRPYTDASPWNTPIDEAPLIASDSVKRIAQINGPLTSDPTQFTYPVYRAPKRRKAAKVKIFQALSQIRDGGATLLNEKSGTLRIPFPKGARGTEETGQLIVLDQRTGREWGVFGLERTRKGWTGFFGYRFSTKTDGVPAIGSDGAGLASRAGASYLAGLVRACEIAQGKIEHALALAYDSPSVAYITPLRGTNGTDGGPGALPIGARIQLDPALTPADLAASGCKRTCLTIARALQTYGAFVVGRSGRPKIYVEHNLTAKWRGAMRANTVSRIPLKSLRVLDLTGEFRIVRKLKSTKPRAGRTLSASVVASPSQQDVGSSGTIFCTAEIVDGVELEPALERIKTLRSGNDRANCAWRIPADAGGKDVNFLVHVVYQHGGARADLTKRIRR